MLRAAVIADYKIYMYICIKHHHRGMGGSSGDVDEGKAAEGSASFSNYYIASPTSQLILQPFRRFTYVTVHSTLPLLHLRHRHFTYFIWRAAHAKRDEKQSVVG